MLGFDALGHLALGEPPAGLTFQLIGDTGAFAVAGSGVTFQSSLICIKGEYLSSFWPVSVTLTARFEYGTLAIAGQNATLDVALNCTTGGFTTSWFGEPPLGLLALTVAGYDASFSVGMPVPTGAYALTLFPIDGKLSGTLDSMVVAVTGFDIHFATTLNTTQQTETPMQFGAAPLGALALGEGHRADVAVYSLSGGDSRYRLTARPSYAQIAISWFEMSHDELWRDSSLSPRIDRWTPIDSNGHIH